MDRIVYTLVTQPGGIDGRDHLDKGGKTVAARWTRAELDDLPTKPWCDVVPCVIDPQQVLQQALARFDPVERLVLELPLTVSTPRQSTKWDHQGT